MIFATDAIVSLMVKDNRISWIWPDVSNLNKICKVCNIAAIHFARLDSFKEYFCKSFSVRERKTFRLLKLLAKLC